jgi:hypothetical protein
VIVAKPHVGRNAGGERSKLLVYGLADRLKSLKVMPALDSVDAEALGRAIIDGGKDRDLTIPCDEGRSGIGAHS